jgi:hypothetical protein
VGEDQTRSPCFAAVSRILQYNTGGAAALAGFIVRMVASAIGAREETSMGKQCKVKPQWQLAKPRLHATAARKLATRREEMSYRDCKKVRRQLKLSARVYRAELDSLLGTLGWLAPRLCWGARAAVPALRRGRAQ